MIVYVYAVAAPEHRAKDVTRPTRTSLTDVCCVYEKVAPAYEHTKKDATHTHTNPHTDTQNLDNHSYV